MSSAGGLQMMQDKARSGGGVRAACQLPFTAPHHLGFPSNGRKQEDEDMETIRETGERERDSVFQSDTVSKQLRGSVLEHVTSAEQVYLPKALNCLIWIMSTDAFWTNIKANWHKWLTKRTGGVRIGQTSVRAATRRCSWCQNPPVWLHRRSDSRRRVQVHNLGNDKKVSCCLFSSDMH